MELCFDLKRSYWSVHAVKSRLGRGLYSAGARELEAPLGGLREAPPLGPQRGPSPPLPGPQVVFGGRPQYNCEALFNIQ